MEGTRWKTQQPTYANPSLSHDDRIRAALFRSVDTSTFKPHLDKTLTLAPFSLVICRSFCRNGPEELRLQAAAILGLTLKTPKHPTFSTLWQHYSSSLIAIISTLNHAIFVKIKADKHLCIAATNEQNTASNYKMNVVQIKK